MTDRYAVFGNPVEHSKSPLIHHLFAQQTGQDLHYDKQWVAEGGFVSAAQQFFESGGKGLNVTVPFKLDACEFADMLSERAQLAGAVNTLYPKITNCKQQIIGDNTDGVGLVTDIIVNQGWVLKNKTILVLGAGGAVRGVLQPILEQQPARLVIANRTESKAKALVELFADSGAGTINLDACSFSALQGCFDVVINGTSASLSGDRPPIPAELVTDQTCCYDMMYGSQDTVFMQWAKKQGSTQVVDGLGMLVEQAAESFTLWRGVRPQTAFVIEQLRTQL